MSPPFPPPVSLGYKMCLHQPQFSLCLGSPTNMEQLRENLRSAFELPTDEETTIMAELEEKFLRSGLDRS